MKLMSNLNTHLNLKAVSVAFLDLKKASSSGQRCDVAGDEDLWYRWKSA